MFDRSCQEHYAGKKIWPGKPWKHIKDDSALHLTYASWCMAQVSERITSTYIDMFERTASPMKDEHRLLRKILRSIVFLCD